MTGLSSTIRFDGRDILPGQTFVPFPETEPCYRVKYVAICGGLLVLKDYKGLFMRRVGDLRTITLET